ncbi:cAMP-dependent protein kinase inhibitor alpha isoform X1 [Manis pentadactyla]|uniref:cAMP-dependent protein kinase inhibitor alpha isoform X1 n=1 Tax=Manis pentadactyla TaxID=143292 RepID=UPI00255C622E|nr:cAMP-dependent protein kinase inhibitor alpha isoform X1 [Manis pentadactyla]
MQRKSLRLFSLDPQSGDASSVKALMENKPKTQRSSNRRVHFPGALAHGGEVPLPPRLARNVVIRSGAGDDFMRPEPGGGSSCCSWQVGWGPAELTGHTAPRGCTVAPRAPPGTGADSIRRSLLSFWKGLVFPKEQLL